MPSCIELEGIQPSGLLSEDGVVQGDPDRASMLKAAVSLMSALLALEHRAVQPLQSDMWHWCIHCATPLPGVQPHHEI